MKKIKLKKIPLKKNIRIGSTALLCIILLFSIITAAGAYQESTTTNETVVIYSYTQSDTFDVTINLKNNSVYNKNTIKAGQETIFKKIVDSIDASFTYNYRGDEAAETNGEYYLSAQVTTDLWEKDFIIVSKSSFNSSKNTAGFDIDFPINLTFYENVVTDIDAEIGINSNNPTLNIKCNVAVSSQTSKGAIYDSFSHSINVSLGGNIIEFGGAFQPSTIGFITGEEEIFLQDVVDNRNMWSVSSVFIVVILLGFVIVTETRFEKVSKIEKMLNKIKKKYGDWIVEIGNPPIADKTKTIPIKSMEDLVKMSEELGKPVMYYQSSMLPGESHVFYVIDESMRYEYILKSEEKIKKVTPCPNCDTKIILEDCPGKKVHVTCPKCGEKGVVTIDKNNKGFF